MLNASPLVPNGFRRSNHRNTRLTDGFNKGLARVVPVRPLFAVSDAPRTLKMKKQRATDAILGELHQAIAKDLLAKVQSGEATAQELSAAIKFLKDNGIQGEVDNPDTAENQLAKVMLPNFEDEHGD